MKCSKTKKILRYIDECYKANEMQKHIENCPVCKKEYEEILQIKQLSKMVEEKVPDGFIEEVIKKCNKKYHYWDEISYFFSIQKVRFASGLAIFVLILGTIFVFYPKNTSNNINIEMVDNIENNIYMIFEKQELNVLEEIGYSIEMIEETENEET